MCFARRGDWIHKNLILVIMYINRWYYAGGGLMQNAQELSIYTYLKDYIIIINIQSSRLIWNSSQNQKTCSIKHPI